MIKKKEIYSQPISELLVIRFEQNVMSQVVSNQGGRFVDPAEIDDHSGDTDWGW